MVEFGTKLRELRTERGWTQRQVAERIGGTASIVSAYENEVRQPSYEALVRLARLYGVSTDYLLGLSGKCVSSGQYLVCLDGLTPSNIALVSQLIEALRE